jgi:hypothetical protein
MLMHVIRKQAIMLFIAFVTVSLALLTPVQATIVNIDATRYGFHYPGGGSDPAPVPGQVIVPITNPPGQPFNQLTLNAGTYRIKNATGLVGADPQYTAWNFNTSQSPTWTWVFVIADNATNKVVFYGEPAGLTLGTTQAAVASQSCVRNYSATFSLATPTTLNFMIRDWFLADNAGGVALDITPVIINGGITELLLLD